VTSLTLKIVIGLAVIGAVGAGGAALGIAVHDSRTSARAPAASTAAGDQAPPPVSQPAPPGEIASSTVASSTVASSPVASSPVAASAVASSPVAASAVASSPVAASAVVAPIAARGRPPAIMANESTTSSARTPPGAPGVPGAPNLDAHAAGASTPPAPSADALAEETRLLREADAATRAGEPSRALTLLEEHARRFPRGVLGEERDAERVLALCAAGRTADARAAGQRFLAARPGSALAGRVRASCGGT
jgi:hypothetical protein